MGQLSGSGHAYATQLASGEAIQPHQASPPRRRYMLVPMWRSGGAHGQTSILG